MPAMRVTIPFLVAALAAVPAGAQQGQATLRWGPPDATGFAAWRAVQAAQPDLATEAREARFDPRQGLRQIAVDLDGDRRAEVLINLALPGWCSRTGCLTYVLTRRGREGWRVVCESFARVNDGLRLLPRDASGWHGFDATYRVLFERADEDNVTCRQDGLLGGR